MRKTLDEIAIETGTDKSSSIHNYCKNYEKYLPFDRLSNLTILEIGVYHGESINMWKQFYPYSKVIGIDIVESCISMTNPNNNIFIEIGSQDDIQFLKRISKIHGPYDLIIDDGSHQNHHVLTSFNALFDYIKPGGVYVIEDSVTSYWDEFGGGYKKIGSSIEYFKELIDDVNFNGVRNERLGYSQARREDWLIQQAILNNSNIRLDIESITFLNSLIIITKR